MAWSGPAEREMRRLDRRVAERIRRGILQFSETDNGDVRRVKGKTLREHALRVGECRVRFAYEHAHTIRVLHVLPRGRAYRS